MTSWQPLALARRSIALLPLLACAACAGAPPIVTASNAVGCSALIPNSWRKPVAGASLPDFSALTGDWISFSDAQTGKLDLANDRTLTTITIIENCEARDRSAVATVTKRKKVLGIF